MIIVLKQGTTRQDEGGCKREEIQNTEPQAAQKAAGRGIIVEHLPRNGLLARCHKPAKAQAAKNRRQDRHGCDQQEKANA